MSVQIEPLRDLLLLRLRPLPETTGLIIRVQRDELARWADVLATGPDVRDVQTGQGALVNPLAGTLIGDDILLPESFVLATE